MAALLTAPALRVEGTSLLIGAVATQSPITVSIANNDSAIVIPASSSPSSERAGITMGSWIIGQDLIANGGGDFFFWNGTTRLVIQPGGRIDIGNSGETLKFLGDNSHIAFYEGTGVTRRAYIQGAAAGLNIQGQSYVDVYIGSAMRVRDFTPQDLYTFDGYQLTATVDRGFNAARNGQFTTGRNGGSEGSLASSDSHNYASIFINPGWAIGGAGQTASIAFHPGNVAPQLRVGYGDNTIYVRSADGVGTASLSGVLINTSSARYKQNINQWPEASLSAGARQATDIVRAMKPVRFQFDDEVALGTVMSERREKAFVRLNEYLARTGQELYPRPLHECSESTCGGSEKDPCFRVVQHHAGRLGFIAEELIEIVPEAVSLNAKKQPEGVNDTALLATVVAALHEVLDRIDRLESVG